MLPLFLIFGHVCACKHLKSVDYPKPIVKHEEVSKENMSKMKLAYDAHKAAGGADKEDNGGCFVCLLVCCIFVQSFFLLGSECHQWRWGDLGQEERRAGFSCQ